MSHSYSGMWIAEEGYFRQRLLPDGRYDETRGTGDNAHAGHYEIDGNVIDYWDDAGFIADGVFLDENTLFHGGMIFRRKKRC